MAKQVPIKAPSPINIVYSSIIYNYSSSIHFWPDFVLSQMAKLAPITVMINMNNVISSISFNI